MRQGYWGKWSRLARLSWLTWLLLCSGAVSAQSLAPPHAEIIEGQSVPVTAHTDQQALLHSDIPAQATRKRHVFDMWRTLVLGGRAERTAEFLAEDFIEHNPLIPTSRAGFQQWIVDTREPGEVPESIPGLVTMVAEGPWVVMALLVHYPEPDDTETTYTSTHFEMFRFEQDRIAEHWDSTLFRAGQQVPDHGEQAALPVSGISGTDQYAQVHSTNPALFNNKRLIYDLWRHIPEAGREELAPNFLDPGYIQHNPNAVTGREGFVEYFRSRPDSSIATTLKAPLVALMAEGDLVVQVLETERTHNGTTYQVPWFDLFRIENARVIEHWDSASKGELPQVNEDGSMSAPAEG